jgi:hypothetical protein
MRLLAALVLLTSAVHAQPSVPPELADAGKSTSGTWRCKGDLDGTAVTATSKIKVELDKWWLVEQLELKTIALSPVPAAQAIPPLRITTYTTYDATAKKWRRVGFDNAGTQMVGTADASTTAKTTTFNLDLIGPGGAAQLRAMVDASDPKVGIRMWGEQSRDKGKSWKKAYDLTCKR